MTRAEAQERARLSVAAAKAAKVDQRARSIADMWQAGASYRAIARDLGISHDRVARSLAAQGIACNDDERARRTGEGLARSVGIHWTDEMVAALVDLRMAGMSYRECAKRIGVGVNALEVKSIALGLNRRNSSTRENAA